MTSFYARGLDYAYQWLCSIPGHSEEVDLTGTHSPIDDSVVHTELWDRGSAVLRRDKRAVGKHPPSP